MSSPSAYILSFLGSLLAPSCGKADHRPLPSSSRPTNTMCYNTPEAERPPTFQASPMGRPLPLELILEIVDHLASPANPSAYTHPEDLLQTLLALSLTSRSISKLAMKHLYLRIYLHTPAQLRAFFDHPSRSLPHPLRRVEAMGFAAGIPLSSINIAHITSLYSSSLTRLDLEGQIQWFTPTPKSSPPSQLIQELALVPGGQRYPLELFQTWSPFPRLKRLAFMHAVLQDHSDHPAYYARLPELFPELEILVLTLPARSRRQLASFAHLLHCLPKLKKAVLIEPCSPSTGRRLSSPSLTPPGSPVMASSPASPRLVQLPLSPPGSPTLPSPQLIPIEQLEQQIGKQLLVRGVEVHEVLASEHGCPSPFEGGAAGAVGGGMDKRGWKPWFSGLVRRGEVWGLEGRVWGREVEQEADDADENDSSRLGEAEGAARVLVGDLVGLGC